MRILTGLIACCWEAANDGPAWCTCWVPEYDVEQAEPDPALEPVTRTTMCDDCAFRPGSPERSGDGRYDNATNDGAVPDIDGVFFCHQGVRRPLRWRHPAGITIEAEVHAYRPPLLQRGRDVVPYKADGTPADRCAGWAAHQRQDSSVVRDLAAQAQEALDELDAR